MILTVLALIALLLGVGAFLMNRHVHRRARVGEETLPLPFGIRLGAEGVELATMIAGIGFMVAAFFLGVAGVRQATPPGEPSPAFARQTAESVRVRDALWRLSLGPKLSEEVRTAIQELANEVERQRRVELAKWVGPAGAGPKGTEDVPMVPVSQKPESRILAWLRKVVELMPLTIAITAAPEEKKSPIVEVAATLGDVGWEYRQMSSDRSLSAEERRRAGELADRCSAMLTDVVQRRFNRGIEDYEVAMMALRDVLTALRQTVTKREEVAKSIDAGVRLLAVLESQLKKLFIG